MTVLITGGAGYIGSITTRLIRASGRGVVVLDTLENGHRKAVGDAPFVQGDVADSDLIARVVAEHDVDVTLWVDDARLVARFLQRAQAELCEERIEGVQIGIWSSSWEPSATESDAIISSNLLIEAFACALPETLLSALGAAARVPIWINLEYLSAESWVEDHHLLASLVSLPGRADPAQKTFFFPGFTARTGGLLRESDLLVRHTLWQREEQIERQRLLTELVPALNGSLTNDLVLVSLFTYESESLGGCLAAMAQDHVPTLCLVPEGRSLSVGNKGQHARPCVRSSGTPPISTVGLATSQIRARWRPSIFYIRFDGWSMARWCP